MSEIHNIISLTSKTFVKGAWHGPTVTEVLDTLTPADGQKRLPNTHSIAELVNHMTAWRVFTVKKLQGDPAYKVTEELNFPVSNDWESAINDLKRSQEQLLAALKAFPEERLTEKVPHTEYNYTFYTLVHGIIHHDLYHLGQIVLINKSVKTV
jgi:uncharacterized damage-inducible protein DinB